MYLYWGSLLLLTIICIILLKVEDDEEIKKREKQQLPLYPFDSTAPPDTDRKRRYHSSD